MPWQVRIVNYAELVTFGASSLVDPFRPIEYFVSSGERIHWSFLVSSYAIAVLLLFRLRIKDAEREASAAKDPVTNNKGEANRSSNPLIAAIQDCFPSSVLFHRSSIVDYIYFYINTALYPLVVPATFIFGGNVSAVFQQGLNNLLGPSPFVGADNLALGLFYSLCSVLAMDLALFLVHYLQHKVPLLWEFHKVHHSAEVLNPITVYRMHPVDDAFNIAATATFTGFVDAVFRYYCPALSAQFTLGNLNSFIFLFYILGYHLRHSHIWLSYGPFWSKLLISPAQHQIHHSANPKHYDVNFGFIFAFWDLVFDTIYVPKQREQIIFGIGHGEDAEYSGVLRLYFLPFWKAMKLLFAKRSN